MKGGHHGRGRCGIECDNIHPKSRDDCSSLAFRIARAALADDIRLRRRTRRYRVLHLRTHIAPRDTLSRGQIARTRVVVHHLDTARRVNAERRRAHTVHPREKSATHAHSECLTGTGYNTTSGITVCIRTGVRVLVKHAECSF